MPTALRIAQAILVVGLTAAGASAGPKEAYLVSYGGYATTRVPTNLGHAVIRGRVGRGQPVPDKPDRGKALDVVAAGAGFVVVTDIDDTIIDTGVTGGKVDLVARIAGSDARDIVPLDGAAEALAAFAAQGVPIVYLTASPV